MKISWSVLWEAVKEPLRLLILALLSWFIANIVPQVNPTWQAVIVVVLRFLDKLVYEYQKDTKTEVLYRGLIGF